MDIVRIDSESLVLQRRIPSDKGFNIDIVGIGSESVPCNFKNRHFPVSMNVLWELIVKEHVPINKRTQMTFQYAKSKPPDH